jgi:hypothetical protein
VAVFRLNDGAEAGAVLQAMATAGHLEAGREYGTWIGGPNGVAPAATQSVVVDLEPGNYVVACLMPAADGQSHAAKGMLATLEVTPADSRPDPSRAALPEVELHEFSFTLPEKFGTGPVNIVNKGSMIHEIDLVRLNDGATIDDVLLYESTRSGAEPYTHVGGTTFLNPGEHQRIDLDLPAGEYAALCFLPTREHKQHLTLGMAKHFTVE